MATRKKKKINYVKALAMFSGWYVLSIFGRYFAICVLYLYYCGVNNNKNFKVKQK